MANRKVAPKQMTLLELPKPRLVWERSIDTLAGIAATEEVENEWTTRYGAWKGLIEKKKSLYLIWVSENHGRWVCVGEVTTMKKAKLVVERIICDGRTEFVETAHLLVAEAQNAKHNRA